MADSVVHASRHLEPDANPNSTLTSDINICFPLAFDSLFFSSQQDGVCELNPDFPIPLSLDDDFDLDMIFDGVSVDDFLNSSGTDEFMSSNDPDSGVSGEQGAEIEGQSHGTLSASGSCDSVASGDNSNPESGNFAAKEDIKVEEDSSHDSSSKRKEQSPNEDARAKKFMKSGKDRSNTSLESLTFQFGGAGEVDEKRKSRLMRNRESAQLSRQRRKHYVEELEEKVRGMHSMISDLNGKISYFMAENASLRQQLSGNNGCPNPLYPPMAPPVPYPWMPYPPYMVKPQGSHVPLVPIPKLKPQSQQQQQPISKKKMESEKPKGKSKKLASVAVLSMLSICLFFGGFLPHNDTSNDSSSVQNGHRGRILVASNVSVSPNNETQPLFASLYVPRNDKLEKIDGNLIIHSVLASDKAKAFNGNSHKTKETRLSIRRDHSPPLALPDGTQRTHFQPSGRLQWFREGLAEPMLSSGMCSEVFQFDVSSSIVRTVNMSSKMSNRRVLHGLPINKLNFTGESKGKRELERNKSVSSTVVSVLVDPREVGEIEVDGMLRHKSLSRIFVVVLLDSVKYVTYSCRLPHIVKT